jgi:hypothetical protein
MRRWPGVRAIGAWLVALAGLVYAVTPALAQNIPAGPFTIAQSAEISALRQAIFSGLANAVGTLPQPAGVGFTYKFDPALGVFSPTGEGFGPIFAQRAETIGRGRITLTGSYTRFTFDDLDGQNLRSGTDVVGFEIVSSSGRLTRLNLLNFKEEVDADVFTIGGLYGVTDEIDVGLSLPIAHVKVKESPRRFGFVDCLPDFSACATPIPRNDPLIPQTAETTDVGDLVLRAKYNFWSSSSMMGGRGGVAVALDLSLPTGSTGDRRKFNNPQLVIPPSGLVTGSFLTIGDPPTGTGIVRVKPLLIASGTFFGVSPHMTAGFELGETQGITNDFVYEAGLDYTFFRRVTLTADLLGRHAISNVGRLEVTSSGLGGTASPDTITGSFGMKVNPFGTLLVFINFLIPLNDTGLRDNLTPTFGLEWSF